MKEILWFETFIWNPLNLKKVHFQIQKDFWVECKTFYTLRNLNSFDAEEKTFNILKRKDMKAFYHLQQLISSSLLKLNNKRILSNVTFSFWRFLFDVLLWKINSLNEFFILMYFSEQIVLGHMCGIYDIIIKNLSFRALFQVRNLW